MHIRMNPTYPMMCSKCGSLKAVKPVNEPEVILRCEDCGHEKREPAPADKKAFEDLLRSACGTSSRPIDEKPTF